MLKGVLIDEVKGRRIPVEKTVLVGRTRDCDLQIEDKVASRHHLRIFLEGQTYRWKDLGSTNGTEVNGTRSESGELRHGDVIRIGETVLRFESGATSVSRLNESSLFRGTILDSGGLEQPPKESHESTSLLEAVYSVIHEIATNYDPCSLTDRILETTMSAIDAQRGAILYSEAGGPPGPCPLCGNVHRIVDNKLSHGNVADIRISSTVAQRVLEGGESVLYQDTDAAEGLSSADSIMSLALRSILCVPLHAKNGILGVLYIDSDRPNQPYTQNHLLLATAVGNSAGIALENARMHHEILEKQRIEQEIATAWTIQEGFLVRDWPPGGTSFEVYGETRPAKTVGGDFYDFVRPSDDRVGLLIGDVSGKGVPAALTMAQMLAQFRILAREIDSPAEVLAALNADLSARTKYGIFCTLCYVTLDLSNGRVVCSNAGHMPALISDERAVRRFAKASGPPAGVLSEGGWENEETVLRHGDTLLLYTDGISEARELATVAEDQPGEVREFGIDGLSEVLGGMKDKPPQELIDAVNARVISFCTPVAPHDDCTMIAVRYLGNQA